MKLAQTMARICDWKSIMMSRVINSMETNSWSKSNTI